MAKRKYVLRIEEAEPEQLPNMPHHHGGWTVRDLVRNGGLADLPLDRFPVDVVQMNLPPGSWQEEGNHKGRWHVNYVLSGAGGVQHRWARVPRAEWFRDHHPGRDAARGADDRE